MAKELQLPEGITLDKLDEYYRIASTEYAKPKSRARRLDLVDNNRLWEAIGAKFPAYQILNDTNHVSYIKNNLLASLYVVGKSARLLPTSEKDKDIIEPLNIAIDHIWSQIDAPRYQMLAGERAALMNLGVTQIGWDNSAIGGVGSSAFYRGRCVLKNINPLNYARDPFAESLDTAGYAMVWDWYHKSVISSNPNYKERFKQFLVLNPDGATATTTVTAPVVTDRASADGNNKPGYYKIITFWVRIGEEIHEIHTIDNRFVLFVKEDLQPSAIPISELYCNLPCGNLFGTSEPSRVLANSIAYNIILSTMLTAEYKNQRPPKFINSQSGLNIASFTKHGNEADRTFIVNGDASKAVHYHQFPAPTAQAIQALAILGMDVKNITGIDDRYTGRDTGSILTTGGISNMLDQVTMIDAPKIANYEAYCKRMTQLVISNYIVNSAFERKYFVQDKRNPKVWKSVTVKFPDIPNDTVFEYDLAISSELPKNKTIIQNMVNKLMEMQMQYKGAGIDVDLITPQEWLMYQDLPNKEYWMERMGIQRTASWVEATTQIVSQYSALVEGGVEPEEAILATADTMQAQSTAGSGVEDVVQNLQMGGRL